MDCTANSSQLRRVGGASARDGNGDDFFGQRRELFANQLPVLVVKDAKNECSLALGK